MNNSLKTYRMRQGLTLEELASKIGVTPAMISYIEKGLRETSGSNWKLLAEILDCTTDELLNVSKNN